MTGRSDRRGRGQALVEFALVLPLLILLFMAIFDLGRAVFAYNAVANTARWGVRTAIVDQYPANVITRAAAGTDGQFIGLTATATNCAGTGTSRLCFLIVPPASGVSCSPSPTLSGCMAKVTVQYTFTALTPVIGSIVGPITLSTTTQLPIENDCNASSCPMPELQ